MTRLGYKAPGHIRTVVAALCLLAPCASATAQQVVDFHTARQATSDAALMERAQQLRALADRQAADEIVAELERLPRMATENAVAHEWLLDRGLHELSRVRPTPTTRAFVERVTARSAQIFVRVDPDHGEHTVPLYDPAATARYVLRVWERTAAREQALADLSAGRREPIERFAQSDASAESDPAKAGIADAFRSAAPDRVAQQRAALIAAIRSGERVDELAAIAAQRLRDSELYDLVLTRADPAVALDAISGARAVFGDSLALDSLIRASERPAIASAALLEIGAIAANESAARSYLFAKLGDPATGASAATALASVHDPVVVAELGRRLNAPAPERTRRHLALALKLEGSPAARQQLDQFLKTRSGSAKLRKEVQTWLAE